MVVPQSRTELAIEAIRKAILSGAIAPGEQLVERSLAEQLGVSKTPIREALRYLQTSGLVESHPLRGMVVRRADATLVKNLYEFRLLIEPTAVQLAVAHTETSVLRRAHQALDAADSLGDTGDFSGLSDLNRTFHELMYERCPNQILRSRLDALRDELTLLASSGWRADPSWRMEAGEHRRILAAVEEGDADKARLLTHAHIESAWHRLSASIGSPDRASDQSPDKDATRQ